MRDCENCEKYVESGSGYKICSVWKCIHEKEPMTIESIIRRLLYEDISLLEHELLQKELDRLLEEKHKEMKNEQIY